MFFSKWSWTFLQEDFEALNQVSSLVPLDQASWHRLLQARIQEGFLISSCFLRFLAEGSVSWTRAKGRRQISDSCCSKGEEEPGDGSKDALLLPNWDHSVPQNRSATRLSVPCIICSLFLAIPYVCPRRKIIHGAMILLVARTQVTKNLPTSLSEDRNYLCHLFFSKWFVMETVENIGCFNL